MGPFSVVIDNVLYNVYISFNEVFTSVRLTRAN